MADALYQSFEGACCFHLLGLLHAQMDFAKYVTSQYPVLKWDVPIELLRGILCSKGLCQLSYFAVFRAQKGCAN
jgi:hypothetical protein